MIVFEGEALGDLEQIFEFNLARDPATALEHIERIRSGVLVLNDHPEIGRRVALRSSLRQLIISHGRSGYVALYEYSPLTGRIRIVAIRHQSEAGYQR